MDPIRRALALPLLSLGLVPLHGCGETEPEPITVEDAVTQTSKDYCGTLNSCDCDLSQAEDEATCITEQEAYWHENLAAGIEAGLVFDGDCFLGDNATGNDCGPDLGTSYPAAAAPSTYCNWFYGSVQEGQPCHLFADGYFDDCARGTLCEEDVCVNPETPRQLGETCLGSCAPALYCEGGTFRCAAASSDGEACDSLEAHCADVSECVEGVCVARLKLGDSCGDPDRNDCASNDLMAQCLDGICAPPGGEGDPCADYAGYGCVDGLRCDGEPGTPGVCRQYLANDEPCAEDYVCQSLSCMDGVCQAVTPWICE